MKKLFTLCLALGLLAGLTFGQTVPEILYYKFDGSGTTVPNDASSPPTGTNTGTIVGGLTQGGTGMFGGALIGVGGSSSSNYVNTGWATNLGTGAWTIMFWTDNIPSSSTLFYQFGDGGASSFRCFTNGVAGSGNWWLRGPVTDVPCNGCAPINTPSMTSYVYDPVAGNIKAYHNATLNNTVAQGALNINGAGPFKVGGYSSSTGMASGQTMDEFRIYNRALDATEIALVYNQTLPLTFAPNDAGISGLVSPQAFCADTQDVCVTLNNGGTDQLTSATINWTLNGVAQTPVSWTGLLDTLNGTGSTDTTVCLGSVYMAPNTPYDLVIYSTNPNGVADTVNYNDTLTTTVQASISGTYQIGGAGADYASFADAVNDLNAYGVCGPVVFNVYDSTYTEAIDLGVIDGVSSTNTITFQAMSGMPTVEWAAFLSTENYTVNLAGASWVSFDGLRFQNNGSTYGRVLQVGGGASNCSFNNCEMIGDTTPTTTSTNMAVIYSNTDQDDNFSFTNNLVRGGSYGAYWYGGGTTSLEEGSYWHNNTFNEQYYRGVYFYYQNNLEFHHNTINLTSSYTGSIYRIGMVYCDGESVIAYNHLTGDNYGYGIYMSSCDATNGSEAKIQNNFIRVGNSTSTSTSYGIYLTGCGYQDVTNNNVNMTSNGTSSRSLYITGGGGCNVMNNNLVNNGPGFALYANSQYSMAMCDHNNLYAPNGVVGYWNGNQNTLADWQAASGFGTNSVSVDPMYYSDDDLHVCSDSIDGLGMAGWTERDFDGQLRAPMQDIGADEFTPISSFTLGADTVICTGDSLYLTSGAAPSDTVLWSTGDTSTDLWVTTPGTYSVSVNSACGSANDDIVVTQSNISYSGFLMADTNNVCDGDTVWLSSTMMADSYLWSTGDTTASIMVTSSGTYTLDITDNCGTGSESMMINFNSAPTASFTHTTSFLTGSFTYTGAASGTTTYAWDFGDGSGTSTLMDPIYLYTAPGGTYVVSLTVTNECGSSTFSDTVVVSSVGMEELANGTVSIYPNPSSGQFNVDLDLTGTNDVQIVLRDLNGRTLQATDLETVAGQSIRTFDLGNQAKGIYLVEINVNGSRLIRKLVID